MIDLYTWPTPNGHKIHIMLEETGTPYRVIPVDIGAGDQFKPEFLKISPNNKMPAMVDPDGPDAKPFALAESGAMLFYLASKTGKFLPKSLRERWQVMQWTMFQMGHIGPMLGGKVAWITGGGSGIGLAGGIELARAGAHVVISGRNRETLISSEKQIKAAGR